MILLAAEGLRDIDIAQRLNCGRRAVARCRKRFIDLGTQGIERDAPRLDAANDQCSKG